MHLQLDQVSVRYDRKAAAGHLFLHSEGPAGSAGSAALPSAVDRVTFSLTAGQIGVLIGPSGCGKTSLLRAVAGLERIANGRIAVNQRVLSEASSATHLAPEVRSVGMVFQDYALFPHLTLRDNIGFGLNHLPSQQRADRVSEMLDLVGLAHAATRLPHQISGGQQQRVALARALAPAPQLLLLDEPFSSLDVDLRERLAQDVRQILKAHGTTALVVTHDQFEAFALGDVIGVMNRGRLEQWDSAYELYHRPASRFVAKFIGHGVFAPAQIVARAHGPCVHTPVGELEDAAECPLPEAYPNGECDVLLRADDIVHDDDSPIKARIERMAFRGSEFLYTLRLDGGQQVMAHVPSHHDHQVGELVGIRVAVDHVVTFPREQPPDLPLRVRPPVGE